MCANFGERTFYFKEFNRMKKKTEELKNDPQIQAVERALKDAAEKIKVRPFEEVWARIQPRVSKNKTDDK